jgi:hypothetical protein
MTTESGETNTALSRGGGHFADAEPGRIRPAMFSAGPMRRTPYFLLAGAFAAVFAGAFAAVLAAGFAAGFFVAGMCTSLRCSDDARSSNLVKQKYMQRS